MIIPDLINKFFIFLIVSFPILSLTGPAIPDIAVTLIAIYFIIISIIEKKYHYYKNPIIIFFFIFSFYLIINPIINNTFFNSLENEGSIFYLRYVFFVLGIWYFCDHNIKLPLNLIHMILIVLTLISIDALYQYFNYKNIFGWHSYAEGKRVSSIFKDELILGAYISRYFILAIGLFFLIGLNKNRLYSYLILISVSLFGLTIYVSGERQALFHFLFFFMILIFLSKFKKSQVLFAILIFISFAFLFYTYTEPVKNRMHQTFAEIKENNFKPYTTVHEKIYLSSLKMFKNNIFLGVGTNTFRNNCKKNEYFIQNQSICYSHPHNYYIQILAENGLVGFVLLFCSYIYLAMLLLRYANKNFFFNKILNLSHFNIPLCIGLFVLFWPFIPNFSFYNNWVNPSIYLILGFFLHSINHTKHNKIV